MKTLKHLGIGTALAAMLLGAIYFAVFTTLDVPQPVTVPESPQGKPQGRAVALVLRWCRPETLKPGMVIVVQTLNQPERRLCRIEKIQAPDPSERIKARGRGRRIAQAIVDMDFQPKYLVSPLGNQPTSAELIYESQIKGKVIHVFEKK